MRNRHTYHVCPNCGAAETAGRDNLQSMRAAHRSKESLGSSRARGGSRAVPPKSGGGVIDRAGGKLGRVNRGSGTQTEPGSGIGVTAPQRPSVRAVGQRSDARRFDDRISSHSVRPTANERPFQFPMIHRQRSVPINHGRSIPRIGRHGGRPTCPAIWVTCSDTRLHAQ